jgi:chromosome partitioning protein
VFSNQKGGVGKTTLTRELGIYLASEGKKVLVIDLDPQANLTRSLTDDPPAGPGTGGCHEALTGRNYDVFDVQPGSSARSPHRLSLLSGDIKMAMLEKSLIAEIDAYTRLRELLEQGPFSPFEYILIDSPPSLGVLTVNALTAAEYLVIPMNPSLYSMQGTNDLMTTVGKVKKSLNPELKLLGVIINAFDSVPVITRQIKDEIESSFGDRVFRSVLSRSIRIEEAIARQDGIVALRTGKVKDEIIRIGEELVDRLSAQRASPVEAV